ASVGPARLFRAPLRFPVAILPEPGFPRPASSNFQGGMMKPNVLPLASAALLALAASQTPAQTKWVATWATAPEPLVSSQSDFNPPAMGLSGNTLRQVLRVSIGGDTLRMRFT